MNSTCHVDQSPLNLINKTEIFERNIRKFQYIIYPDITWDHIKGWKGVEFILLA